MLGRVQYLSLAGSGTSLLPLTPWMPLLAWPLCTAFLKGPLCPFLSTHPPSKPQHIMQNSHKSCNVHGA